jgi:hypothetical protein
MSEDNAKALEPPDKPCEYCGHLSPRLSYDRRSRKLLCPDCERRVQLIQPRSDYRSTAD